MSWSVSRGASYMVKTPTRKGHGKCKITSASAWAENIRPKHENANTNGTDQNSPRELFDFDRNK